MTIRGSKIVLAAFSLLLTQVHAGLLDSPPPTINGVLGQVVYRMGPIYYDPGHIDTVVKCTNLDATPAVAVIELFDQGDNRVGTPMQGVLAAGGTVNFVTSGDSSRAYWVVIPDLAPLEHGKARISATTANLSCAAYHRFRATDGSIEEKALELVKKVRTQSTPTQ